jgi:AcrR family transcriptional regulator
MFCSTVMPFSFRLKRSIELRSIQIELYSIDVKDVKSPSGSLRAERAAITRRRIAQAARTLFASRGYTATTLLAIAIDAGVAVQTVYAVYGSKANILRALGEELVNDPPADAAYVEALAASDTAEALTRFAHSIRLRWQTGHDIVVIGADAASADPRIRIEMDRLLSARRRGIAELARSLAKHDAGLADEHRTAAVIEALTLPELYGNLVGGHGWNADAYELWLATALRRLVMEAELVRPGPD